MTPTHRINNALRKGRRGGDGHDRHAIAMTCPRIVRRVTILTAGVAALPAVLGATQTTVNASYPYRGSEVAVTLHTDSLAVGPASGVPLALLIAELSPLGLRFGRRTEGGLPLFGTGTALSRRELWQRAAQVEAALPSMVERAGLVFREPEEDLPFMISRQFVVYFAPDVSARVIDSLNAAHGVTVVRSTPGDPDRFVLTMTSRTPDDPLDVMIEYDQSPLTIAAQPDFGGVIVSTGAFPAIDPLRVDQWHLNTIDAVNAWTTTQGDPSVVIAVLEEDGFQWKHEDLINNVDAVRDEVTDLSVFPTDKLAHGTAVAGLVAAEINAVGGTGVCPKCRLLLVRGGNVAAVTDMAEATNYARLQGADVITNSWVITRNKGFDIEKQQQDAWADGIVVLQSMPNIGAIVTARDRCQDVGFSVEYLGASPTNIAIASSTDQDLQAVHSSEGACLDLLAPGASHHVSGFAGPTRWGVATTDTTGDAGYNIMQLKQDLTDATGEKVCPWSPGNGEFADRGYTKCFGGNSAATPIVAGVVGLMLSVNSTLSPDAVRDVLRQTADKIGYDDKGTSDCTDDDNTAGYAPTCPMTSDTRSDTYGYGRVNALAAVQMAQGLQGTCTGSGCGPDCENHPDDPRCQQTPGSWEIGVRFGLASITVTNGEDRTVTNLPGGGPVGMPVVYADWIPVSKFMLEGQLGFSRTDYSLNTPDTRILGAVFQPTLLLNLSNLGKLYVGVQAALDRRTVGTSTTTEWGFGGALGIRYRPNSFIALRLEALLRQWTTPDLTELGLVGAAGVVF